MIGKLLTLCMEVVVYSFTSLRSRCTIRIMVNRDGKFVIRSHGQLLNVFWVGSLRIPLFLRTTSKYINSAFRIVWISQPFVKLGYVPTEIIIVGGSFDWSGLIVVNYPISLSVCPRNTAFQFSSDCILVIIFINCTCFSCPVKVKSQLK